MTEFVEFSKEDCEKLLAKFKSRPIKKDASCIGELFINTKSDSRYNPNIPDGSLMAIINTNK